MLKLMKKKLMLLALLVLVCGCLCGCQGGSDGGDAASDADVAAATIEEASDLADAKIFEIDENTEFEVTGMYLDDEESYIIMYRCENDKQMKTVSEWDDEDVEATLGAAVKAVEPYFEDFKVDVFASVLDEDYEILISYADEGLIIDDRE